MPISPRSMPTKRSARAKASSGGVRATGMPAINEHLNVDDSVAARLARTAGMTQIVMLPVIENAQLNAVLAWYL